MPGSDSWQILRAGIRIFSLLQIPPHQDFWKITSRRKILHSLSPGLLLRSVAILASFSVLHKTRDTQAHYWKHLLKFSSFGVYRACQKGETKSKTDNRYHSSQWCCIAKMVFLKCTLNCFVYSSISGFEVHDSHAKTSYQHKITEKMLKLQTEKVFSWSLWADPNLQLPTIEVHLPWARPAAPSPLVVMCLPISNIRLLLIWCEALALVGSQAPTQLLPPPWAGQERKQEEKEQENSWVKR